MRLKLLAAEPWMVEGLCRQVDPDLWFADKGDWPSTVKAKKVCFRCPVRIECADFAMANREQYGVWGGLTPEQRKMLRRQGRIPGELAS